ncbi:MAG: hypothetical protein ACK55Z_13765 [bacterium]
MDVFSGAAARLSRPFTKLPTLMRTSATEGKESARNSWFRSSFHRHSKTSRSKHRDTHP